MSSDAIPNVRQEARDRRERVLSYTLVELLITLVFIASAYGVLAANEGNARIAAQNGEITALRQERDALRAERDRYQRWMERLWAALRPDSSFPANPEDVDDLVSSVEGSGERIRAMMGQAPGLPVCTIGPELLLSIIPQADGGLRVAPLAGSDEQRAAASSISGVAALENRAFATPAFSELAAQVSAWGRAQTTPCRFRVEVARPEHNQADLYLSQLAVIEAHFYARKRQ